jgi:adenylate cyclase
VRGRSVPLRAYELLHADHNVDQRTRQFLTLYHEGLRLFRARQWNAAQQAFTEARAIRPHDCATNLYLSRIDAIRDVNLPEDWKGVFELTTK